MLINYFVVLKHIYPRDLFYQCLLNTVQSFQKCYIFCVVIHFVSTTPYKVVKRFKHLDILLVIGCLRCTIRNQLFATVIFSLLLLLLLLLLISLFLYFFHFFILLFLFLFLFFFFFFGKTGSNYSLEKSFITAIKKFVSFCI